MEFKIGPENVKEDPGAASSVALNIAYFRCFSRPISAIFHGAFQYPDRTFFQSVRVPFGLTGYRIASVLDFHGQIRNPGPIFDLVHE